ncbi:Lrp/AsnC family transcriptional regulator [Geodermatophilus sp. SYSU D00742]
MVTPSGVLDDLDRRIVAALQVDGRASWRQIATALDEPERTVARRGTDLLAEGRVLVRGLPDPRRARGADQYVFRATCTPGTAAIAAVALARRPETLYSYVLTGSADCAAELSCPPSRFAELLTRELGGIPGVAAASTYPVLHYFRTMHEWRPPILTPEQIAELTPEAPPVAASLDADPVALGPEQRSVLRVLAHDGRATYEEIARLTGVSLQTARRRVAQLRAEGLVHLRAIFEPAILGFGTEALLWVQASFGDVAAVGEELIRSSAVRYASVLAGDRQLLVDVVARDQPELYRYLQEASWVARAASIEPSFVVEALKRSGTLTGSARVDDLMAPL